jgi:PAS domain S-box-containing protein
MNLFRSGRQADATDASNSSGRRTPLWLSLAVLGVALVTTFGAWESARQEYLRARQTEFDFQARLLARRIAQRMATYEQVERGTQAFLLGSMDVQRDNFRLYVKALRLDDKFPGIQGIALARLVPAAQLGTHIQQMRRELPNYALGPDGERPIYSAITHIEPATGLNLRAFGFDMLSEPIRRQAMERARDTGEAAASGKVRLIQESGKDAQAGLVMYLPVYRRASNPLTVAERRANIIGWVGAPFRMADLMAGLGDERSTDISLSIYDGAASAPAARLYSTGNATPEHQQGGAALQELHQIDVAGRMWTLDIRSTARFDARIDAGKPRMIAGVGSTVGALLALLVWTLASGRRRAVEHARKVTHQLSDSEFRWKYALEGAGDGVWDWDRSSNQTVYSQRWKRMLGYADGDLSNSTLEWERLIHPDEAASVLATLEAYLDSTSAGYEAEYRMRCKDDSWRWIRARGMAVSRDAAGKPIRTIGTHTDISRMKEHEKILQEANERLASEKHRARVILDNSHDAFVAVTSAGRVTDWNAKAELMFGYCAAEAIGRDLEELIIPVPMQAAHHAGFERFVQGGPGVVVRDVVEMQARHRDGSLLPVELAIASFPVAGGVAVSAFIRNISERKQAQRREAERSAALEEARIAMQHAQKLEAVGKLTGGVAHDFNNVLHVIGGNVQLLQQWNQADERLQARLRIMKASVDRGAKLASQLLSFARRQPLQPVALNLLRTVHNMDDLLQRALGESVQLRISADTTLWNVMADLGQLENVILNLAINARDAMPGGGTLTLQFSNVNMDAQQVRMLVDVGPGEYVKLSVQDCGSGMSADIIAQAFDPFFTTKPVGQGTGLGLSMAYGFVKQSGGHIAIDSAPGQGTTVAIYLPRCIAAETVTAAPALEAVLGGAETILVAEDDADVRSIVVSTLSDLGYRVIEAADGACALAMIESGCAVDLLLIDVVMPGPVSSTELARLARQILPTVSVLYTSGYTRDALTSGGRLVPGVQLLGKPYSRAQLAKKISEVLLGMRASKPYVPGILLD